VGFCGGRSGREVFLPKFLFSPICISLLTPTWLKSLHIQLVLPMAWDCNGINPFRSCVGPRPTLWFSCSRRFSSCSTDFSQQITQVVLFLFLFFSFKTVG
jgi:hypothetical protein